MADARCEAFGRLTAGGNGGVAEYGVAAGKVWVRAGAINQRVVGGRPVVT